MISRKEKRLVFMAEEYHKYRGKVTEWQGLQGRIIGYGIKHLIMLIDNGSHRKGNTYDQMLEIDAYCFINYRDRGSGMGWLFVDKEDLIGMYARKKEEDNKQRQG